VSRWTEIATIIDSVLVAAGVLVGGTRWAVESAVEPLHVEVRELRQDIGMLRDDVHALDVRVARLEEGQQVIVMRLERVETRLDSIEAQKVAAR